MTDQANLTLYLFDLIHIQVVTLVATYYYRFIENFHSVFSFMLFHVACHIGF